MIQFFMSHSVSVSVRESGGGPYGRGFNCRIEVGVPVQHADALRLNFLKVMHQLDHKAWGVDVGTEQKWSLGHLVNWIAAEIRAQTGVQRLTTRLTIENQESCELQLE